MSEKKQLSFKQTKRQRMFIISYLLFALILTIAFGTLEDPIRYTLSNIGNRFGWRARIMFIIWAVVSGSAIETAFIFIMKLVNYSDKKTRMFIGLTTTSIILTALIPALQKELPFWHTIHVITSILIAIFFLMALVPLVQHILTIIPDYKIFIYIWMFVIWAGSVLLLILYNLSAICEIWFFVSIMAFLIYLTFILYDQAMIESYHREQMNN
ncbi:MAG TPA: hypothetical protein VJ878_02745 [Candidatus Izemoplasmatales bacterium]|nr:hypothetical protein [Candidatus Izemoplasmatales bacterium]